MELVYTALSYHEGLTESQLKAALECLAMGPVAQEDIYRSGSAAHVEIYKELSKF
jgi:hypothetical protein